MLRKKSNGRNVDQQNYFISSHPGINDNAKMCQKLIYPVFLQLFYLIILSYQQDVQRSRKNPRNNLDTQDNQPPYRYDPGGNYGDTNMNSNPSSMNAGRSDMSNTRKMRNSLHPSNVKQIYSHKNDYIREREERKFFHNITKAQLELKKELRNTNIRLDTVHKNVKGVKRHLFGIEVLGTITFVVKMVLPMIQNYFWKKQEIHEYTEEDDDPPAKQPARITRSRLKGQHT